MKSSSLVSGVALGLAVAVTAVPSLIAAPAHAGLLDPVRKSLGMQAQTKLLIVQVDVTGSIGAEDWSLYERAFAGVLEATAAGDRVVVAQIGDKPVSKFLPVADRTSERKSIRFDDEAALRKVRAALNEDFKALRAQGARPASATFLLDAVASTEQLVQQGRAQGREVSYVILSDMVEESRVANFNRTKFDEGAVAKLIEARRTAKLLPDLAGVKVYVVGASGRTGEDMMRIRGFWTAFFQASGATLVEYGRNPAAIK